MSYFFRVPNISLTKSTKVDHPFNTNLFIQANQKKILQSQMQAINRLEVAKYTDMSNKIQSITR